MSALVLSGGGVYGAALLGALHHLWFGLNDVVCVAGTSIGAIIGTLLVMGHSPIDLLQVVLKEKAPLLTPDFSSFGFASQNNIRAIVQRLILAKCTRVPTFAQMHEQFGVDLVVTGTNLTDRKAVYFHRHDFPDMSVLDALMISSCVPFVFPYITYAGAVYVDGFVADNFPVRFVERFCPSDTRVYGLWTHQQPVKTPTKQPNASFQDYTMAVFNTFLSSKTYPSSNPNSEIHRLDIVGDYNPLVADAKDLEALFYEGSYMYIKSLKENPRKSRDNLQNDDPLSNSSDALQLSAGTTDLVGHDRTVLKPQRLGESEDCGVS